MRETIETVGIIIGAGIAIVIAIVVTVMIIGAAAGCNAYTYKDIKAGNAPVQCVEQLKEQERGK